VSSGSHRFFPRASERRFFPILEVCILSSHLYIFSSSHLLIFSSSHLLIFTSSHLHIFSSSNLLIFTFAFSHLLIFTFSFSHLHICSSSHLLILPSCPLLLFYFSSEGGDKGSANETARNATLSHGTCTNRKSLPEQPHVAEPCFHQKQACRGTVSRDSHRLSRWPSCHWQRVGPKWGPQLLCYAAARHGLGHKRQISKASMILAKCYYVITAVHDRARSPYEKLIGKVSTRSVRSAATELDESHVHGRRSGHTPSTNAALQATVRFL
jgi:hypothetical protein